MHFSVFYAIKCFINRDVHNNITYVNQQRKRRWKTRSINKLQNSVILLVFQMLKIRNIRFVGNLILSSTYEFYDDDVTVTSFINIKFNDVATEIIP